MEAAKLYRFSKLQRMYGKLLSGSSLSNASMEGVYSDRDFVGSG